MPPTEPSDRSVSSPDDDETAEWHCPPLDETALTDTCPPVRRASLHAGIPQFPVKDVWVPATAVPKRTIRSGWSIGDPVDQCVRVLSEGNDDKCRSLESPFCLLSVARPGQQLPVLERDGPRTTGVSNG
jgi:hypothetical protein